ncbi:MAG TPA: electron transfer flavoprotein subunit beta/FixA family protein [Candidatus Limnocylindrales bacterium]|nr:electron transfer flavoprotein subunit beta/FixA family protein [Candidatus Limnocylindrales bacterium]
MHIVVFTRSTPDTAAKVEVDSSGRVGWGDAALIVNPWDEYALEEAITRAKDAGGKVTVVALGGETHADALKHALAMGVDEAVRVDDPALEGADSLAYAITAAAAARKIGATLIFAGKESIDVNSDQHLVQLARKLGWPYLSNVAHISALGDDRVTVERLTDGGKQIITSRVPAVLTVTKGINEPRYPSFIGIRKASKAVIPVWSLADLEVSLPPARTAVTAFKNLPARETKTEMLTGTPAEQAAALVDRLIEEKVL